MICINDTKTLARFWAKVDKSGDCWIWTACKNKDGYGQFHLNGSTQSAHRIAWMIRNGSIPDGLHVLHDCDNPPCVRHLFLGTHLENIRDMEAKGRHPHVGNKGEEHWNAKLNFEKVRIIRARYNAGGILQRELAEEAGVSQIQISKIIRGIQWAEL